MAYKTSEALGVNINYVGALPYWDALHSVPSPGLGTRVAGSDGHTYILVVASANIAANTAIIITEPAMTAAAGGGTYSTGAVAPTSGQYFWARSNAL